MNWIGYRRTALRRPRPESSSRQAPFMRRGAGLALLMLLTASAGCGGPENTITRYLQDVADFVKMYQKIIVADTPREQLRSVVGNPDSFAARVRRDVEQMKALADLPEDALLILQLKYGPAVESALLALEGERQRVKGMIQQQQQQQPGGPPAAPPQGPANPNPGAKGENKKTEELLKFGNLDSVEPELFDSRILRFLEGYRTLAAQAKQHLQELAQACAKLQNDSQAGAAVAELRRLHFKAVRDAVYLEHLKPRRTQSQLWITEARAQLTPLLQQIEQHKQRLRGLGKGGQEAARALEPWPPHYQRWLVQ
jgi:hypothetical protein